ncbi:phosphate ABC transporter permease PstA [Candidatus Sororendozoicomonas aggregata]|uniref:phosphate ABC transporter permease PstA n=1 Tax=Candidatus Sororendozoicomonas aggregata TaxID=3073239 RepID=UPI002ED24106
MNTWFKSGLPWVWLNAGAVAISLILVVGLLALIASRGLGYFWPDPVMVADYKAPEQQALKVAGAIIRSEVVPIKYLRAADINTENLPETVNRSLLQTGTGGLTDINYVWLIKPWLHKIRYPTDILTIERQENSNFHGYLKSVKENGATVANGKQAFPELVNRIERTKNIYKAIEDIQRHHIVEINEKLEQLRLKKRRQELNNTFSHTQEQTTDTQQAQFKHQYQQYTYKLNQLYKALSRDSYTILTADGTLIEQPVSNIVRAYHPNNLSITEKIALYFNKLGEFLLESPREANSKGGIFPAIFGTIMMVILMSIFVTPFGVITAVYLHEYAQQGTITRIVRIAVNNLAGVPSIVYGIFGLGFLVYFVGGNIDKLFFPEALPAPTFGTPGLLWASITLSILTLPVVIVATEEGLSQIPTSIREGSLSLGATRAETLWHVVLPMASPAMITGLILAIARAAGEVAPLMLVGVAKLVPNLPVDSSYPFIHLDQKFMHLAYHIYDFGFQSPDVETSRSLVYATALLLILIIVTLNFSAVVLRNHLREKYKRLES